MGSNYPGLFLLPSSHHLSTLLSFGPHCEAKVRRFQTTEVSLPGTEGDREGRWRVDIQHTFPRSLGNLLTSGGTLRFPEHHLASAGLKHQVHTSGLADGVPPSSFHSSTPNLLTPNPPPPWGPRNTFPASVSAFASHQPPC